MSEIRSLTRANQYIHSLLASKEKLKEKTEEAFGQGLQMVEVGGAAFLAGYANSKFGDAGEWTFKGVPVDLIAGLGIKALALGGMAGKYGEHAGNVADGLVAAYAYRAGMHLGAEPDAG